MAAFAQKAIPQQALKGLTKVHILLVLIVEDDELFALRIKRMLKEIYAEEVQINHCLESKAAKDYLEVEKPDIALIDVVLEDEKASIEIARILSDMGIAVIFMTAFRREDLFEHALEVNPENYILKPFSSLQIKQAIELALVKKESRNYTKRQSKELGTILLTSANSTLERVPIKAIIAVESSGNYCQFYRLGGVKLVHRMPLKNYSTILPDSVFIQIHRRYVINLDLVDRIDTKEQLVWAGGLSFPYGKKYQNNFIDRLS
ncbi:MAG: response regulator transcription factor [Bacteroidota bacterium]